jgi:Flp pilus assembly protein CpaB
MEFAQRVLSTRAGTIGVAAGAAFLAGISILVYLNQYRHSVSARGAPVTVLVASRSITKGTSGAVVDAQGFFRTATIRQSQLRDGAISDPAALRGRVAVRDVYRGQQLTTADFVAGATSIASTLAGTERVLTIPLDSAHGMIGQVQEGDHVDVFVGFNVTNREAAVARPMLRRIMQDIPVVAVGDKARGIGTQNSTTNVSLKVNDRQAAELAFAADNGKIWLALRPGANAAATVPATWTIDSEMLGLPPLATSPGTLRASKRGFWTGR